MNCSLNCSESRAPQPRPQAPATSRCRRALIATLRSGVLTSASLVAGLFTSFSAVTAQANPAADAPASVTAPADAQTLRIRSLAASCAQCHGTDGQPVAGSALPTLAGMPAQTLRAQMQAFKDGTRPASVMTQLARGFSAAQIDQLASFFAAQAVEPSTRAPS